VCVVCPADVDRAKRSLVPRCARTMTSFLSAFPLLGAARARALGRISRFRTASPSPAEKPTPRDARAPLSRNFRLRRAQHWTRSFLPTDSLAACVSGRFAKGDGVSHGTPATASRAISNAANNRHCSHTARRAPRNRNLACLSPASRATAGGVSARGTTSCVGR